MRRRVTAPIVRRPRDRVGQHCIGRRDLLEPDGGVLPGAVRVPPQGEPPPYAAELRPVGIGLDAEKRVIVVRSVAAHAQSVLQPAECEGWLREPAFSRVRSRTMIIVLWLFVIDLGIAFGAGLYEQRMIIPQWFSGSRVDSEAMRRTDPGRRFWAFVTTMPLTLLTLASLALAWKSQGGLRDWWLEAAAITLVERVGTFAYFIPTALRLMRDDVPPEAKSVMAVRWRRLNLVRGLLSLLGWLAALEALSLSGAPVLGG